MVELEALDPGEGADAIRRKLRQGVAGQVEVFAPVQELDHIKRQLRHLLRASVIFFFFWMMNDDDDDDAQVLDE